jgi:hypothetical protein
VFVKPVHNLGAASYTNQRVGRGKKKTHKIVDMNTTNNGKYFGSYFGSSLVQYINLHCAMSALL